jgi:hypothetical protein
VLYKFENMPLDHVTINVSPSDFKAMVSFYQAALSPLGYEMEVVDEGVVGLGVNGQLDFYISQSDFGTTRATHVAFTADSKSSHTKMCGGLKRKEFKR